MPIYILKVAAEIRAMREGSNIRWGVTDGNRFKNSLQKGGPMRATLIFKWGWIMFDFIIVAAVVFFVGLFLYLYLDCRDYKKAREFIKFAK